MNLNKVVIRERLRQNTEEAFNHIKWMAQTVHQAYHQDIPGTWQECPRDICGSTQELFTGWRKRMMDLVEEAFV